MQLKPPLIPILLFFFVSTRALACLCAVPATPCGWYATQHGRPTFVGVVVSDADDDKIDVLKAADKDIPVTIYKVRFLVEEPFEDVRAGFVDVYGWGNTCDYHFKVGGRYLVYGSRDKDGKIRTSKCTRTAPLTEAAEDLKFLRSLPNRIGGEIIGTVRFVDNPSGIIGGTVTASGSDGDHRTRVAPSGKYELRGLAPGEYRLTFTPDGHSAEHVQLHVSIPVNGSCAETGVRLGDTTISGSVINEAGLPIAGADVFLSYALDGNFHPEDGWKTRTDTNGRFIFDRVEVANLSSRRNPPLLV